MHDHALDIYIQLGRRDVFEYIMKHSLLHSLDGKLAALINLNEGKALDLLVENSERVEPEQVVTEIRVEMSDAQKEKSFKQHQAWRKRLFHYMDRLVSFNIMAAPEYHALLVGAAALDDFHCPQYMCEQLSLCWASFRTTLSLGFSVFLHLL